MVIPRAEKRVQSTGGRFLVFEGIDGSGKTTQIKGVHKRLEAEKKPVLSTCEPTDGSIGTLIRKMLAGKVEIDQLTIAALFAADRTDHLMNAKNGIRKAVDQGKIVLCDRYYFSSYAYHAQHMELDWVIQANSLNAQILKPHATLFIDVAPETCLDRIKSSRTTLDMYEKIDILKQVRKNYFKAFKRLETLEKVIVIDGNDTPDRVGEKIWQQLGRLI